MNFLKVWVLLLCFLVNGCATYRFNHHVVTTTTAVENGVVTVVDSQCVLIISSLREVDNAKINVDSNCNAFGGAQALGANEKLLDLLQTTVQKIPSLLLP